MSVTVPMADLVATVDAERARRAITITQVAQIYSERFGGHRDTAAKAWRRALEVEQVDLDFADRWLTALDLTIDDLPAPPVLPGRARGGGKPAGVYGYLTDAQVRACHVLYMRGESVRSIAERIAPRTRYATVKSCANGLWGYFVRLDLPRRSQSEATIAANHQRASGLTKRELKVRRGEILERPLCAGVKAFYPRRGAPCQVRASAGSAYCAAHDPTRAEERRRHLAAMRNRLAA